MINLHDQSPWSISTKVWDRAGIELATPGSAARHASVARHVTDCATRPGTYIVIKTLLFSCFLLSAVLFSKSTFFEKIFQEYHQSVMQAVWSPIRPNVMSGLILFQTVCKSYQQTTLVDKELMNCNKINIQNFKKFINKYIWVLKVKWDKTSFIQHSTIPVF